jgi:hypothetical protein
MIETIFTMIVVVVVGVNVATTVSPRFRRWLHSKDKQ